MAHVERRRSRSRRRLRPVAFRLILDLQLLHNGTFYRIERYPFMYFRSKEVALQRLDELAMELWNDMDMELSEEPLFFSGKVESVL